MQCPELIRMKKKHFIFELDLYYVFNKCNENKDKKVLKNFDYQNIQASGQ